MTAGRSFASRIASLYKSPIDFLWILFIPKQPHIAMQHIAMQHIAMQHKLAQTSIVLLQRNWVDGNRAVSVMRGVGALRC